VKRISSFTNSKICDDLTVFYSILDNIAEFVVKIFVFVKAPEFVITAIDNMMNSFTIGKHYQLIRAMVKLTEQWTLDKKIILKDGFKVEVQEVHDGLKNRPLQELCRRSASTQAIVDDFDKVYKCLLANKACSRVEPVCFVFEGPPGCFKSVTMTNLVKCLRKTTYTHLVKSIHDGKDFYDTYNNEELYVMDDVGQQGKSQWRSLINMVGPVRMPLDCADAKLKDTKTFNSSMILLTTNCFMNLGTPLQTDCIQNIDALWRRGMVFDFSQMKSGGSKPEGVVTAKYYDLAQNKFVQGFPASFEAYCKRVHVEVTSEMTVTAEMSRVQYLKWFRNILVAFEGMRSEQHVDNELTEEELAELNEDIIFSEKQGLMDWVHDPYEFAKRVLTESFNYLSSSLGELLVDLSVPHMIVGAIGVAIAALMVKLISGSKPTSKTVRQMIQGLANCGVNRSTAVDAVTKQTFEFDMDVYENGEQSKASAICVVSGHLIITVAHVCKVMEGYITIYENKDINQICVDHAYVTLVHKDEKADVAIFSLPHTFPTPFKNLSKFYMGDRLHPQWLITPDKPVYLPERIKMMEGTLAYDLGYNGNSNYVKFQTNNMEVNGAIGYNFGMGGLCGSPAATQSGQVVGHHVAGKTDDSSGFAIIWSNKTRLTIGEILKKDDKFAVDLEVSCKPKPNYSGIKLDYKMNLSTPKTSCYRPTGIFGVFPVTRAPADMMYDGKHTIKTIETKAYTPVKDVVFEELQFAEKYLETIIQPFGVLSDEEIIAGTDLLAGLNKDSSNGFGCETEKSAYIDFPNKRFTERFTEELAKLEEDIARGEINWKDLVWTATLKQELRSLEKAGKPRSFRICRVHVQVLTKRYFGRMVENVIRTKDTHGIMVGCNPFKDWPAMYKRLSLAEGVWAGDIGSYDGQMLPQVQMMLCKVLMKKGLCKSIIPEFLLTSMPYQIVGANDDLTMTTHSMPSGSFLTAIVNSLVNKCYTAMWYHREHPTGSVYDMNLDIIDYVYGDDKLNGVNKLGTNLNAVTMRDWFESMGMTFTDAKKQPISSPVQSLDEVSFLKRSFRYHSLIGDIVGPLDITTLYSGLSWYDNNKDYGVVMRDKINSFQREIFLHEDLEEDDIETLRLACDKAGLTFAKLPTDYLVGLYTQSPEEFMALSWGGTKYI